MVQVSNFTSVLEINFGICTVVTLLEMFPRYTQIEKEVCSNVAARENAKLIRFVIVFQSLIARVLIGGLAGLGAMISIVLLFVAGAFPDWQIEIGWLMLLTFFSLGLVPLVMFAYLLLLMMQSDDTKPT